ncbi:6,7-dimethyl-8-ribityllumazine synthase [Myxococcota bacterium]|nr:6,7-dimethyl-8-ribityllumazine synthase [Myxococcota bacterium]
MTRYIEGQLFGKGYKICVVVSRFNSLVTERLLEGAIDAFSRSGLDLADLTVIRTPGALEIPATARRAVASGKYDGMVCLGAVVRGDTPHFDYVSAESVKGVAQLSMQAEIPVIMGILTTDTMEQALDRAGAKAGNKGFEAARGLLEMIHVFAEIGS